MDDYVNNQPGQSTGGHASDQARDGARRLRHNNGKLIDLREAFERSHVMELHGRPYPVQWRSQGAENAWAQVLGETKTWSQWAAPETIF